jgi:hypothetical protein
MEKIIGPLTLLVIIWFSTNTTGLQAQTSFKFPLKLKFTIYQDQKPVGAAALFYTQDTGIDRFNRELSSLRWIIQLEEESEFQYMQESYIFRDNLSLYRDSIIFADRGVTSQATLKELLPSGSANLRIFVKQAVPHTRDSTETRILDAYKDISKISSILTAARAVAAGSSQCNETFQYFEPPTSASPAGRELVVKMIYIGKMQEEIARERINTEVVALNYNSKDIHHFKFYKDSCGYYFPVVIDFDVNNNQRGLQMRLDLFPKPFTAAASHQIDVVYLEFIDAKTWSIKHQTPVDQLVHQTVYREIRKEFNKRIMDSSKQLVLQSGAYMNTTDKIKQLIDITFEQDITPKMKVKKMIDQLNIPGKIDVIVTGQYTNNPRNPNIMIRPIIIFKNDARIITNNLMFNRTQMICRDPATNKNVPCPQSYNYIAGQIKNFISSNVTFNTVTQGLTIEDVYRMIIENGFFCHSVDYGSHFQVLDRLRELERIDELNSIHVTKNPVNDSGNYSYTFKSDWDIKAQIEQGKEIIRTVSINKKDPKKNFTLYWDIVEGQELTYEKALRKIDQLNAQNNEGHWDWRLPTLAEVLSIASYNNSTKGFFPFRLPQKVKIWTSTPLEENEKNLLTFSHDGVYFVVKTLSDGQAHQLQFDILDKDNKAFLLPVRSAASAWQRFVKSGNKGLLIANLAFMKTADRSPMVFEDMGQSIDNAVKVGMNMAAAFNNLLTITDESQQSFNTGSTANYVTNIFFNPNLSREEKIRRIIGNVMRNRKIDLLVTGYFIDDASHDSITLRPMVIYKYNQDIQTENLQFRRSDFECKNTPGGQKTMCQQAADQLANAVKKLLDRS